ncbi:MAG TPA: site-specific integrase [Pseudonocardia sp.]|jgi:integrase|nr:site-specific integrase [Pseudonocardia sp.]
MSGCSSRRPEVEQLVAAYRADLRAAGMFAEHPVTSPARTFLTRVGIDGWQQLSAAEQCATSLTERRVVGWLMVTARLRPTPDYLVLGRPYLGEIAARHHRGFHDRFRATATELGFAARVARLQWSAVVKLAVLAGVAPDQLTEQLIAAGVAAMTTAIRRHRPNGPGVGHLTGAVFGARTVLFHLGVLDAQPRIQQPNQQAAREAVWAQVPPRLATTLRDYIAQVRLSLRPATMVRIEGVLREFAGWIAVHAPDVGAVADLRRPHIEAYKLHLAARPSARGGRLSKLSLAEHLGTLRTCFERLTEWAGEDVPARVLVFSGDLPLREDPLPRFLDDGAFTKLLQAARTDEDPFVRLCVEFLARTGMRKGEFLDLTVDSVVQIGAAYWLHVPLGKLRSDRYIPLHPQLKQLLDDWIATRPAGLRSPYLLLEYGRRVGQNRVDRAVAKTARTAGIGHVTAHQLRHTLATQAINRGMSLEAIAALLGHRSMRMTMVYARIADRTVADEYFAVSEQVEALYDTAPKTLPGDAEGAEMRKLRAEMHRRMLGNGYCARPVGLDCHFESICESCTFFQTTIEFRPTLQRQRDDADAKGQQGRKKIFDGLLSRLDDAAS